MAEDIIGKKTLDVISEADNFNKWMYETIRPHTRGSILEIGSGIGNISKYFLRDKAEMTLSDYSPEYCRILKTQFGSMENCKAVVQLDLVHEDFEREYAEVLGSFDTVFALNVIEHIEDDYLAIRNCRSLLKEGGNLIILVPSYQSFYNKFDEELGHYRRYTKSSLSKVFKVNDFTIKHTQCFNMLGLIGWYFTGSILKKNMIPGSQMKLFNQLVPMFKIVDNLLGKQIGLSTIVTGKKIE